jgi:hypothetical protein
MPTLRSASIPRRRASFLLTALWSMIASISCAPIECTGLNEVIGSWKTRPISPPRIERISAPFASSLARSTCEPSVRVRTISPSTMRPGRSTIRRIDCAVTLFPQPLSPTMPSVFPGATSNEAPSTALVVPSSWKKLVLRFLTERSGLASVGTNFSG